MLAIVGCESKNARQCRSLKFDVRTKLEWNKLSEARELLASARAVCDPSDDELRWLQPKVDASASTSAPTPAPAASSCTREAAGANCEKKLGKCVENVMRPWTPECRRKAFDAECATRCFSFETDDILNAAASPAERRALLTERVNRNRTSIELADDLYTRASKFIDHARAIGKQARESDPNCFRRLHDDFATVDGLVEEVKQKAARLPTGMISLGGSLLMSKDCVHCSDDAGSRATCDTAIQQFKEDADNLNEMKKELAADEAALKAL